MRSLNRSTFIGNLTKMVDMKSVGGELVIAAGYIAINYKVGEKEKLHI